MVDWPIRDSNRWKRLPSDILEHASAMACENTMNDTRIDKWVSRLRATAWWTTIAIALTTLVVMIVAFVRTVFFGDTASRFLPGLLIAIALLVWTESAYLFLIRFLHRRCSRIRTAIVAVSSLVIVGASAVVVVDAFLIRPDPQNALVLLFLPVLQWVGCAITLILDVVAERREVPRAERTRQMVLRTRMLLVLLTIVVGFAAWWLAQRPSNDRDWVENLVRPPRATIVGDTATIHNVRNTRYRSAEDYTATYEDRTYDLTLLRSVDFIVVPFASVRAGAHTFLSFGFDDGRHVAISVEVRRERGESFSPLWGMLRQCELIYVIADERDVLSLRAIHRMDRVYLYPVQASPKKIRDMFVSMLRRANRLHEQPEFYNTLTSNCTSNILRHFNDVSERPLAANLKVLFPGYSDRLLYDLGLIDNELPFDSLRRRCEITEKIKRFADVAEFSRRIRE